MPSAQTPTEAVAPAMAGATATTASPIVSLSGLSFTWPGARSFGLRIPAFDIARGTRLLLTGPSGSGKTTLLNLLCGITQPTSGSVEILGTRLSNLSSAARDRFRSEHIGVIFQMFNLLPYGTVIDNVLLPLSFAAGRRRKASANSSPEDEARRLLSALGLPETHMDAQAATLSIGQQQRVAAARALIGSPELVIADEPTSALDRKNQDRFLDLLFAQLSDAHATLIMVSHDDTLASHFDRVVALSDLMTTEDAP